MTKQQAYELACNEFPEFSHGREKKDRAMEIYAAAFAEWKEEKYEISDGLSFKWQSKTWAENNDISEYTTAELLIEFEKL